MPPFTGSPWFTRLTSQIVNNSLVVGTWLSDALNFLNPITANTTITVAASGGDYTTIQAAWDSLKGKRINPDVSVTISVAAGDFTQASALFLRHPNGDRIFIVGAAPVASTLTGFVSATGAAANWTVTLNVANTAGMVAGNYVICKVATGTVEPRAVEGFWEVLSVPSSTQIVVKNTYRKAAFPAITITGGTIICLKTYIKANGCDGIQLAGPLGSIYNIGLIGNGTAYDGVNINQRGTFYANHIVFFGLPANTNFFAINGFGRYGLADTCANQTAVAYGMVISNVAEFAFYFYSGSVLISKECIASGCGKIGCYAADGSKITWYQGYTSGNAQTGVYAYNGSVIMAQYSESWGNVYSGYQAVGGAYIDARNAKACNNGYNGFNTNSGSSIYATSSTATGNGSGGATYYGYYATNGTFIRADSSTASGNTNGDYKADYGSRIRCPSYVGSPTFSPAKDLALADGTIISTTTIVYPYKDLIMSAFALGVGASAPDLVQFLAAGGLRCFGFDGNATPEQLYGTHELQHDYQEGTNILFHVHWAPTTANAGDVKWQLEYSWQNTDGTFGAATTISIVQAAGGTAWVHKLAAFAAITGTGFKIGSVVNFRLFRDPTDGSDTYVDDAGLLSIGIHYLSDTLGSSTALVK